MTIAALVVILKRIAVLELLELQATLTSDQITELAALRAQVTT